MHTYYYTSFFKALPSPDRNKHCLDTSSSHLKPNNEYSGNIKQNYTCLGMKLINIATRFIFVLHKHNTHEYK